MTAEEILYDELNDNQIAVIETYPFMKQWVIQAMEVYASQEVSKAIRGSI
jgi:hypothetical protein